VLSTTANALVDVEITGGHTQFWGELIVQMTVLEADNCADKFNFRYATPSVSMQLWLISTDT